MRDNMNKVLERDQKLGDLEDKAGIFLVMSNYHLSPCSHPSLGKTDGLREGANRFEKKAVKLKRKMQWKNIKVDGADADVDVLFFKISHTFHPVGQMALILFAVIAVIILIITREC